MEPKSEGPPPLWENSHFFFWNPSLNKRKRDISQVTLPPVPSLVNNNCTAFI